jgi:hypothetical protein
MPTVSRRWLPLAFLCLLLAGISSSASARDDDKSSRRSQELDEAVRSVRHRTQGQILSAKTHQDSQRRYHKIRVLTPDGRVRNVRLPAENRPASRSERDQRQPRDKDEWRR